MEQWLATNWWILASLLGGAAVGYYRISALEKEQDAHLDPNNKSPHPACPVHNERFSEVVLTLSKIEARLETLDERIYAFMRSNGYHDRVIERDAKK